LSLGGFRSHFSAAATEKLKPLALGGAYTPARTALPRGENARSRRP
jgi:hypothetical protein